MPSTLVAIRSANVREARKILHFAEVLRFVRGANDDYGLQSSCHLANARLLLACHLSV